MAHSRAGPVVAVLGGAAGGIRRCHLADEQFTGPIDLHVPLLGITAVARWPDAAAIRDSVGAEVPGDGTDGGCLIDWRIDHGVPFPAPIYQVVQVRRIRCRIRQVGGDTHPAFDRRRHIGRRWGGRPLGPTLGSLWNPRREIVDIRGP
jgi:hypothetical protein